MPTYNDEKYLTDAIDDILNQTYKNYEFIIVNDGSTDNTADILKKYSAENSRIKIINKINGGTGSALNVGFSQATGKYGTWVSSDDRKDPEFIKEFVKFLETNPDIEYACSAYYSVYLEKDVRSYIPHSDNLIGRTIVEQGDHPVPITGEWYIVNDWAELNYYSCMQGVCFMFTMALKNKMGDYSLLPGEDYIMAMKMALNSRVGYLDKVMGIHENPPDALSNINRNCVAEANTLARNLFLSEKRWPCQKIPKVANFYWGSRTMSFLRYLTIFSFKKYNPSWSIHLYVPKNISKEITWKTKGNDNHHKIDNLEYSGKDYFQKLLSDVPLKLIEVDFSNSFITENAPEPHKSDLLTWQILGTKGGLWCDMDIIFFEPITMLNIPKETDTGVCYDHRIKEPDGSPTKPIGFLLSSSNNKYFRKAAKASKDCYFDSEYQSIGTNVIKRMSNTLDISRRFFPTNVVSNIDPTSVYYLHFQRIEDIYKKKVTLPDGCIGIHWYGGHPLSQEYNNRINHENYHIFDNTICDVIERVLE